MNTTNETLQLIRAAQAKPLDETLQKAWTQATGLVNYDLQAPSLKLYPVITPLRNMIARVGGNGGTATNWKAVTGINTTRVRPGVSEGNRGGIITTTVVSKVATYKGIGLEDSATFEADYASTGFEDVKVTAVEGLLRAVMIAEEELIVGGNGSLALGTCGTPTLAAVVGGGSLANSAHYVYCVVLTLDGYLSSTVAAGLPGNITRTNADGTTDTFGGGNSQVSSSATVTPAANGSIQASVTAIAGAVAYAWYWGTSTGAGSTLGAITTANSVLITVDAGTGTQAANDAKVAADYSVNALVFDGLITQISTSGSNSYYKALATGTPGVGTKLTTDNAGGVTEINTALKSFWDNYRLSPELILVNAQELNSITNLVVAAGGAPLFRFNMDNGGGTLNAGVIVGNYLNKFTMDGGSLVKVMLHPNVPPGTIIFYSKKIPYPLSNVTNVMQFKCRRDYYQIEWPVVARKYQYGVYVDEVLQNYFPPAFGLISNISP